MMDIKSKLESALAVCDAATEGPFRVGKYDAYKVYSDRFPEDDDFDPVCLVLMEADARLFAHASTGYPAALRALLEIVEYAEDMNVDGLPGYAEEVCAIIAKNMEGSDA